MTDGMDLTAPVEFPFESQAKQNGVRYWIAHDLMASLGYESYASFKNIILKAVASCAKLGIETHKDFAPDEVVIAGKTASTYRLTRFACFLITLHADGNKPNVAAAKIYFAAIAESILTQAISLNDLERLELRSDLRDGENAMEGAAAAGGLKNYAFFKNAGFVGMYNMSLANLKRAKGVSPESKLYDLMGTTEMAGNWFRVTQTAERIKTHNIKGQSALESAARLVGKNVRQEMIRNGGVAPERLKLEEDVNAVKRRISNASKDMAKLDASQIKKIAKT